MRIPTQAARWLVWIGIAGCAGATGILLFLRPLRVGPAVEQIVLPPEPRFLFAAVGDSGTGRPSQVALGRQAADLRRRAPFGLVLMLGDNVYDRLCGTDPFRKCFEEPFASLIEGGAAFYAVIGNHESELAEIRYGPFNMEGRSYYTFSGDTDLVQFFALDSAQMGEEQVAWLDRELAASRSTWKIPFFHKPIYNAGTKHGPDLKLRAKLEPLLLRHRVRVALSGHEHVYERLTPGSGIVYFVCGSSGHVNHKVADADPDLAAWDDSHHCFMLFAATRQTLFFWAITSDGLIVDQGGVPAPPT